MPYPDKAARQRFAKKMAEKERKKRQPKKKKGAKVQKALTSDQYKIQLNLLGEVEMRQIEISGMAGGNSFTIVFPSDVTEYDTNDFAVALMSNGVASIRYQSPVGSQPIIWSCIMSRGIGFDITKIGTIAWSKGFATTKTKAKVLRYRR